MSMILDIPNRIADQLRTLAVQRGVSVEELGEQALDAGLATLTNSNTDVIIDVNASTSITSTSNPTVPMRSPIIATGPLRPLNVIFEPIPKTNADAH